VILVASKKVHVGCAPLRQHDLQSVAEKEVAMSRIRQQILSEIALFREATGMSETRIGLDSVGDGHLVRRLRLGHGTQLSTIERLDAWMSSEMERRAPLELVA